jgi:hypothetical protein
MMWEFSKHIATGCHSLTIFHQHSCCNRQLHFGQSSQAQVCATLALANALAVSQECPRSQAESMPVKLQDNIVILIRANPQAAGFTRHLFVWLVAAKIHDLALNRATRRIGSETVHANNYLVGLAIEDALVRKADVDDGAVDRADNTEWHGGYIAARIAKYEGKVGKQQDRKNCEAPTSVLPDEPDCDQGYNQKGNAFPGDKWITPAFQTDSVLFA